MRPAARSGGTKARPGCAPRMLVFAMDLQVKLAQIACCWRALGPPRSTALVKPIIGGMFVPA